jgi:hypothetical protein
MTQSEVLAEIAADEAKLKPYWTVPADATTGGADMRSMALLFDYLCWDKRANRLRALAHEFDRMEAELNRRFQEEREAHAVMEGLKT